jgi:carboxypeptidase Q
LDKFAAVERLHVTDHANDVLDGTDNFDFLISGVPNLVGIQDPVPYLPDYHAESDTVDRVNLREEKITEAVADVLMWGLGRIRNGRPGVGRGRKWSN